MKNSKWEKAEFKGLSLTISPNQVAGFRLAAAARLIEAHAQTLSRESTVCAHCSRESFTNWDEHLEAGELDRIVVKLRKLADLAGNKVEKEG